MVLICVFCICGLIVIVLRWIVILVFFSILNMVRVVMLWLYWILVLKFLSVYGWSLVVGGDMVVRWFFSFFMILLMFILVG